MCFYGFLLHKILEILQFLQYSKIDEAMESVGISLFYRICVLAAATTMRLLILEIWLTSVFHFVCKAILPVYYTVSLPLLLSKKILLCTLCLIQFLTLCTLRLIILFLRFSFYFAVLFLLSVFLTSNISCIGNAFNVNVICIVNDNFNGLYVIFNSF